MLIVIHILIALASLLAATVLLFKPSKRLINFNKVAIISTLVSGTALVIDTKSGLIKACFTGLIYLAFAAGATYYSSQKLQKSAPSERF